MKSNVKKTILRGKGTYSRWLFTVLTLAALVGMLSVPAGVQARAPQAAPFTRLVWSAQRADAPKIFYNMNSHSFKIDKNGVGHVAYGGDHLYYARLELGQYQRFTVDPGEAVGQFASLALDSNNVPHISYYDAYNGTLKYARSTGSGGQWLIEVIDTPPAAIEAEAFMPSEVDVQADKRPGQEEVFEAEGQENQPEAAQSHTGGVGMYSSITIDSQGRPHISYYDAVNRNLKYAYRDNSHNPPVWVVDTVNNRAMGNDYGTWTSIATVDLGQQTLPVIAFMDETLDDLKFVFGKVGEWEPVETVDGGDIKGGYTSIALDKSNNIFISYYACGERTSDTSFTCSKGDLKFARRRGEDNWETVVLDSKDNTGGWTSLAIDAAGKAHLSFYDFTDGDLWYAYGSGTNWTKTLLASTGDVGRYTSVAVDASNYPHITYVDFDGAKMVEVYKALDAQKKEKWFYRDVDYMADVGYSTSLAFKSNGVPLISYFDNTSDDLKLTKLENNSWMNPPLNLASSGSTGIYTSLKINSKDSGSVAYYDSSKGNLMYTYWDGAHWLTQTVSSYRDVGRYPSLALNAQDVPMISYYDGTLGDLVFGSWDVSAGRWITQTVDTGGDTNNIRYDVGQFSSLKVDAQNRPHISYYDVSNGALKYATWNGMEWIKQVVDDDTDDVNPSVLGLYTSLALDANGVPHISYYECGVTREGSCDKGDLKHAWNVWTGTEWVWNNETVDNGRDDQGLTDLGLHSSLAIRDGQLFISYYDLTNHDLKLAYHNGLRWDLYTVDSPGDVGRYSSVAVDPSGKPHISYYDSTNGDLKLASAEIITIDGTFLYLPLLSN